MWFRMSLLHGQRIVRAQVEKWNWSCFLCMTCTYVWRIIVILKGAYSKSRIQHMKLRLLPLETIGVLSIEVDILISVSLFPLFSFTSLYCSAQKPFLAGILPKFLLLKVTAFFEFIFRPRNLQKIVGHFCIEVVVVVALQQEQRLGCSLPNIL